MTIFGGNTGVTYDDLQRRRKVADALLAQNARGSRSVGEGIGAIGRALAARAIENRASRQENKMRDDFNSKFAEAAPQAQSMLDLYDNPMATDGQKKVLGALMKGGVPGFSRGGRNPKDQPIVVGEAGPELIYAPEGAEVVPNDGLGLVPDFSTYGDESPRAIQEDSRFDDANSYQVADSGQIASDAAPTSDELAKMGQAVGIPAESLKGLDLNATEARNFGYILRMMEAENTIRELQDSNTLGQRLLEFLPGRDLESMLMDPDYRRYTLARENFNEAALRAATGATINQQEMPMQRQNYFPLPTDDDDTRQLLQRQRQALMMALAAGSGPGASVLPEFGQAVVPRDNAPAGLTDEDAEFLKSLGIE